MLKVDHEVLNTRESLIETTEARLDELWELGYTQPLDSLSLGKLAVVCGVAPTGALFANSLRTGVVMLEHPHIVTGRPAVTVQTLGRFSWSEQFELEPTRDELLMLDLCAEQEERAARDRLTRQLVTRSSFDPALSILLTTERILKDPNAFGLPDDVYYPIIDRMAG